MTQPGGGPESPDHPHDGATAAPQDPSTSLDQAGSAGPVAEGQAPSGSADSQSPEDRDAAAAPPARIHELESELASLRTEHQALRDQYMRIAADFDNFRKRQSRDQDDLRLQIACNTLSEILPVVDNFDRARQQLTPQTEEAQSLHRSYQGLYKQLVDVFKQIGRAHV